MEQDVVFSKLCEKNRLFNLISVSSWSGDNYGYPRIELAPGSNFIRRSSLREIFGRITKYLDEQYPWIGQALRRELSYLCPSRFYRIMGFYNLFFDFYVMYEIYYRTIGIMKYSDRLGENGLILPYKKEAAITSVFEETVGRMKEVVRKELRFSVYREARHIPAYIGSKGMQEYYDYVVNTANRRYGSSGNCEKLTLEELEKFYSFKWSENNYGGKRWMRATTALIELEKSNDSMTDVFWIDRVFDLEHNTGHILDKGELDFLKSYKFRVWGPARRFKVNKNCLDFRHYATIEDMIPMCSSKVQKIYCANKNYLNQQPSVLVDVCEKKPVKERNAKIPKKEVDDCGEHLNCCWQEFAGYNSNSISMESGKNSENKEKDVAMVL